MSTTEETPKESPAIKAVDDATNKLGGPTPDDSIDVIKTPTPVDGPLTKTAVANEQKAEEAAAAAADSDEPEESAETREERQKREEEERQRKREEDMDALIDMSDGKVWVIGRPPENGGSENEYSKYIQKSLGYIQMMRFMGIVTNAMSEAVKAGGTIAMEDLWGGEGLSWRERGERLRSQDFADAGSFAAMALKLVSYSPNFLLDCYVLWLDVPAEEKTWARRVMAQPWRPEDGQWGLKADDGYEMMETFIDQNYEDIRSFFVDKLPRLMLRLSKQERDRKKKEDSVSPSSKPSKQ